MNPRLFLLIIRIKVFLLIIFLIILPQRGLAQSSQSDFSDQEAIRIFNRAYNSIRKNYITSSNSTPEKLLIGAIEGMIDSLNDPHTVLLRGKKLERFIKEIDSHYSGIGIYIDEDPQGILVVDVIEGSPAWEIGIKPKDIIIKAENVSLKGMSPDQTKLILLGPKNTIVKVVVLRKGKEIKFHIIRKTVIIKTVQHQILPTISRTNPKSKVGYISITTFSRETARELKTSLDFIKREKATALVIDLRNNPGGILRVVSQMVDFFINKGLVVSTMNKHKKTSEFKANRQIIFPPYIPIAILVNRYSASASEIFAGALRDHKRAILVGEKTYGKFSVQSFFPLWSNKINGQGTIKMTIAKYFLPNGDSYDGKGILPNIAVINNKKLIINPKNPKKFKKDPVVVAAVENIIDLNNYLHFLE